MVSALAAPQGNSIASAGRGIWVANASNIIIRGNTIARSGGNGIELSGVTASSIGTTVASARNIIGGNGGSGIALTGGSSGITIHGNTIGTATIAGGTFANQGNGILLNNVSNIAIGNGAASGRNLLSGNGARTIQGNGTLSNISISGNYIGTDASGNVAVESATGLTGGNRDAIAFFGMSLTNLTIRNNVIGGHIGALVELWSGASNGSVIQGNNIGIGADGVSQIVSGNVDELVNVGGNGVHSNLLIGGSAPGEGNLVAFSDRYGVRLNTTGTNVQVIGNTIRNNALAGIGIAGNTRAAIISNRIFANGLLGIDLVEDGVSANDPGDGDAGPNDLLNFPEAIRAIVTGANQLGYNFTLDAPAAADGYRIEFFASTAADPTGHGEGARSPRLCRSASAMSFRPPPPAAPPGEAGTSPRNSPPSPRLTGSQH